MEQLKNKKSHAEPASMPLEINSIQDILRWIFIESSAKWLFIILLFEYIVAVNLSPTILTDYPLFNWVVESMASISPGLHNYDHITVHPEAVRFFFALTTLTLIPKSICIYYFLMKNPITAMNTYVITINTTKQPASTSEMFINSWQKEEEATLGPQKPRSMLSRVFWTLMILLFTAVLIWVHYFPTDAPFLIDKTPLAIGWFLLWANFTAISVFNGLFLAISYFIIWDYIQWFKVKYIKFKQR